MDIESSSADHLVQVALAVFGRSGLDGASTREIARAAGRPMSAITYHFGGKEGMYLACARHIADTIGGMIDTALEDASAPANIADARAQLARLFALMTHAMVREETAKFARFIVREQQEPTEAFDILYGGVMGRMLARMVSLMRVVAGEHVDEIELRVRVIAMMGQVLAFRTARAATLRLTGWSQVGDEERVLIDRAIQTHLAAILDNLEQEHQR